MSEQWLSLTERRNETGLQFVFITGRNGYQKVKVRKKLPDRALHVHAVNQEKRGLIKNSEWD